MSKNVRCVLSASSSDITVAGICVSAVCTWELNAVTSERTVLAEETKGFCQKTALSLVMLSAVNLKTSMGLGRSLDARGGSYSNPRNQGGEGESTKSHSVLLLTSSSERTLDIWALYVKSLVLSILPQVFASLISQFGNTMIATRTILSSTFEELPPLRILKTRKRTWSSST